MIEFTRIDATRVVDEHVTVRLMRGEDGNVLGRVTSVGTGQGGDEEASTEGDDPPIEFALRIARELATAKRMGWIDILDPDHLWEPAWGVLDPG